MGPREIAAAYRAQRSDPEAHGPSFDERMGLLVDREWTDRQDRRRQRRFQEAHLRLSAACVQEIDYHPARGLDRSLALSAVK